MPQQFCPRAAGMMGGEMCGYIPRIRHPRSSRTSAKPEASNMTGALLLSGSAHNPACFRLLLAATRRSVPAKPASLFRHKVKTDQCHFFCGLEAFGNLWKGRRTQERRRLKDASNLPAAHWRASHPFSCSQVIIKQQNAVGS